MPLTPRVSVVTPTYKRRDLLERAAASVRAQTVQDWEWVVSDDEDPPAETWAYLQQLAESDPRVRVVRNPGPHGQVGNVNYALTHARAPWVKVLYDDDALLPHCLERFLAVVEGRDSVAMVSCGAKWYRDGRLIRSDDRGGGGGGGGGHGPRVALVPQRYVHLGMYLQETGGGPPSMVMVRKAVLDRGVLFEQVPGLVSAVDSDWNARVLAHGDLLELNEPLVEFHQGGHETVTSRMADAALDREYVVLRERQLALIDPSLRPPSLRVVGQMLSLIRAMHRLKNRKPLAAARIAAGAWHPRAWVLAGRWALRMAFPGKFRTTPVVVIEP